MYTIAIFGPRPTNLFGYGIEANKKYTHLRDKFAAFLHDSIIAKMADEDHFHFVHGGAQGSDMVAHAAILMLQKKLQDSGIKVTTEVAIPFVGQEEKWTNTGMFSKDSYLYMVDHADEITLFTDEDNAPTTAAEVAETIAKRNLDMVNRADAVIALSDLNSALLARAANAKGISRTAPLFAWYMAGRENKKAWVFNPYVDVLPAQNHLANVATN